MAFLLVLLGILKNDSKSVTSYACFLSTSDSIPEYDHEPKSR